MNRLTQLQQERLKKRRQQNRIRLIMMAALLVLIGVNAVFLALNIRKSRQNTAMRLSLSQTQEESTVPTETILYEPSTDAPETEAAAETTAEPEKSVYEEDPRYEAIRAFDNFGFVFPTELFADIYEEPSSDSRVIGKARCYSGVNILESTEYYYRIEYEGCEGYVLKDCIKIGEEAEAFGLEYCHSMCEITSDGTPILCTPNDDAAAVCFAEAGKPFKILEYLGDWYKVDNNVYTGYVRMENVYNRRFLDESYFFQRPGEKISDLRLDILDYAFEWFGSPYVWGGETLGEGVDCSAYVMRVFEKFDILLPRLSVEQSEWGKPVASMEEILPGDLLFYHGYNDAEESMTKGVGHVGIYIGNGRMIHAASTGRGIVVDDYDYVEKPSCIRRVIKE